MGSDEFKQAHSHVNYRARLGWCVKVLMCLSGDVWMCWCVDVLVFSLRTSGSDSAPNS